MRDAHGPALAGGANQKPETKNSMSDQTSTSATPNDTTKILVERAIEEQAGLALSQMTGEQAVAAMVAASSVPVTPPTSAAPPPTAAQLLAEYLTPHLAGAGPQASRSYIAGKAGALLALVNTGQPVAVQDVVNALLT